MKKGKKTQMSIKDKERLKKFSKTLKDKVLFKEKLDMANRLLENAVLPKVLDDKKYEIIS